MDRIVIVEAGEREQGKRKKKNPLYLILAPPEFENTPAYRKLLEALKRAGVPEDAVKRGSLSEFFELFPEEEVIPVIRDEITVTSGFFPELVGNLSLFGRGASFIAYSLEQTGVKLHEVKLSPSDISFNVSAARTKTVVVYYKTEEFKKVAQEHLNRMGIRDVIFQPIERLSVREMLSVPRFFPASVSSGRLEIGNAVEVEKTKTITFDNREEIITKLEALELKLLKEEEKRAVPAVRALISSFATDGEKVPTEVLKEIESLLPEKFQAEFREAVSEFFEEREEEPLLELEFGVQEEEEELKDELSL